jgi:hypothetical protein
MRGLYLTGGQDVPARRCFPEDPEGGYAAPIRLEKAACRGGSKHYEKTGRTKVVNSWEYRQNGSDSLFLPQNFQPIPRIIA